MRLKYVVWLLRFCLSTIFLLTVWYCHPLSRRDSLLPADRADLPVRIRNVAGGLYSVEDGNFWKTNSAFYIGDDSVYFFDATYQPSIAETVLWKVMTMTQFEFRGLILTSHHQHHAGGAFAFQQEKIPILIQRNGADNFESNWLAENQHYSNSFSRWTKTPLPKLRGVIDQEFVLEKGKVKVIYPGEGWSNDNLVVLFVDERVLYGGSLVAYPPLFAAKSDSKKAIAALNRVEKLPFDTVISGHGEAVQGREIFSKLRSYYLNRDR